MFNDGVNDKILCNNNNRTPPWQDAAVDETPPQTDAATDYRVSTRQTNAMTPTTNADQHHKDEDNEDEDNNH